MCWFLFGVHSTHVLLTMARKRTRSFCQKSRWQITPTRIHQRSRNGLTKLSRHSVGKYQENELTDHSAGNTPPQSSQLAETLWTDPGLVSETGVRCRTLPQNSRMGRKKPPLALPLTSWSQFRNSSANIQIPVSSILVFPVEILVTCR